MEVVKILEILRTFLSAAVIALAGYSLITKNFLGVLLLFMGVSEIQAKRKTSTIIPILAPAFSFLVSIYTF